MGRQYDSDGNLNNWWHPKTLTKFLEKVQCIIDQYGNYTDLQTNLTLNGINTQGENIADNGGTRAAYIAYNKWIKRKQPEGILPGLKYNQQQLFWISFAQTWCDEPNDEYIRHAITTDPHSPNQFRVNGVVSNMHEFASDFNCPVRAKMNPEHKCQVW